LLSNESLIGVEMQPSLALRWLSRCWAQYREDRGITLGAALIGAECSAERDAFLALLDHALPSRKHPLFAAIRLVRQVAIRPIAAEAIETANRIAASLPDLDAVLAALAEARPALAPLDHLLMLVECFRYSHGENEDRLSATALTPCWALNLAAAARAPAFGLSASLLPCPGVVQRRLFRADRSAQQRRAEARNSLLAALHATAEDIAAMPRAAARFAQAFPKQRSNSRLSLAWMLLFGLGGLTPAQLARALPATKAGAGKLLRQLEAGQLARGQGVFAPYVPMLHPTPRLPDWYGGEAG
jgi:hypothetical protein